MEKENRDEQEGTQGFRGNLMKKEECQFYYSYITPVMMRKHDKCMYTGGYCEIESCALTEEVRKGSE